MTSSNYTMNIKAGQLELQNTTPFHVKNNFKSHLQNLFLAFTFTIK